MCFNVLFICVYVNILSYSFFVCFVLFWFVSFHCLFVFKGRDSEDWRPAVGRVGSEGGSERSWVSGNHDLNMLRAKNTFI